MNSIKDQLENLNNERYSFVRRDKEVRAKVIADLGGELLIETVYGRADPAKRVVTQDYFDNNYWEGIS